MAKGAAAVKAARKREEWARGEVEALTARLREATDEVGRLKRKIVEQDALKQEIERLREMVAAGTSAELERALRHNDKLLRQIKDAGEYVARVEAIHEKTGYAALVALGGGRGAMEDLAALLNGGQRVLVRSNDHVKGLPIRAIEAIEGKRTPAQNARTRGATLIKLVEDAMRDHEPAADDA